MSTFFSSFRTRDAGRDKLAAELQPLLAQVKAEREALADLLTQARAASKDLEAVRQPIADAERTARTVDARTSQLNERLLGLEEHAAQLTALGDQVQAAGNVQRRIDKQLSVAAGEADRLSSSLDFLRDTVATASRLKDDMAELFAKGESFAALKTKADEFGEELHGLQAWLGQVRGQHDDVMRLYEGASTRVHTLDEQYRSMTEGVADSDRRAAHLERKFKELDEIAEKVADTKRQLDTLNALAGYVTKKIAAIEQQRDAVERAAAQGAGLQALVRQIDGEVERQHANAERLAEWEPRIEELRQIHANVLDRSDTILERQHEVDEAVARAQEELTGLRAELKKTADRFDLEHRGLDSVGQRIVDLRASLVDIEERFRVLEQSRKAIATVEADAGTAVSRLEAIAADVESVEDDVRKLRALHNDVERLDSSVEAVGQRVGRIEQMRPGIEAALGDLGELKQSQETVRDALEQVRHSHAELTRFREVQRDAEGWLARVAQSLEAVEAKVDAVETARPQVELVGKEVDRVLASVEAVESRREFLESIHARLADLASRGTQLEDREQQLESRMDAAEKRFVSLSLQADDADRVGRVIFGVTRQVEDAERRMVEIVGSVGSTETRFSEVEALAERTRQLGADLEQRESAVQRASENLERASSLRAEAAAMVQELEGQARKLVESLAMTEARTHRLDVLNGELDARVSNLRFVEKRIAQFEEQLAKWELAEQEVQRGLEEIGQRQRAIDALGADIKRLTALAERAMEDVRAIAAARDEVRSTRELLEGALASVGDGERVVEHLERRKTQLDQAETRLARADALVIDLQSGIETLESQRAIVEHVVEQAGVLEFQSKQAEALIETLRQERELASRMHAAVVEARKERELAKRAS